MSMSQWDVDNAFLQIEVYSPARVTDFHTQQPRNDNVGRHILAHRDYGCCLAATCPRLKQFFFLKMHHTFGPILCLGEQ